MIELLLAFLLSTGWLSEKNETTITTLSDGSYGVVSIDETGCRKANFIYDEESNMFFEE